MNVAEGGFVAEGWCTKKLLGLNQTIRSLTSGDADGAQSNYKKSYFW